MVPTRAPYRGQSYKLYDDYNDIHIFVEDANFENLYRILFKKYGVRVENIFSKSGKDSILDAAKLCSDDKCVFIVDRDWDDIFDNMPTLKNVVVLTMHSIECYLVTHSAFAGIVLGEKPKCNIEALLSEEHFQTIITDVSDKFRQLFECFVVMQMQPEKAKGCSHKPGHFQQKNKFCAPDTTLIRQFITDIGVVIPQPIKDYFSDESLVQKGHGKFILHYIWEGVRNKTKVRTIGMDTLMIRLAQLTETQELEELSDEIKKRALAI